MKCSVLEAWETEQRESRVGVALSKSGIVGLAAVLTALLWAGIIKVALWAAGMTIGMAWFVGILGFIGCASWLVLNAVAASAGGSEQVEP